MATINQVISRVDELNPTAIDAAQKAAILISLDGKLYEELTREDAPEVLPPQKWPEDGDKPLLASGPYESLYELYLSSMLCFWLREYAAYNNIAELFNQEMDNFKSYYRRTHVPKPLYLKFW